MPTRRAEVPAAGAGMRLDRFLADAWPDYSRSFWRRQIDGGRVRVDGRAEKKAGYPLRSGQTVAVEVGEEVHPDLNGLADVPREWPSWVVYHDASVIVINKPRNLVVHPAPGHWLDSVVAELLPWLPRSDGQVRPGVVHRLDRDTSGLMVLARTLRATNQLSQAIQRREVVRQYVAVVRGHLAPAQGVIEAPIGRHPRQRLKMAVVVDGRPARTRYRSVAQWPGFSMVQCTLETGRTHQIRVHLSSLGHPVVGDGLYGGKHPDFVAGQLLHAARIRFLHPEHGQVMEFLASPPSDWSGITAWGPAEITEPRLFPDADQPTTAQWLSALASGSDIFNS